MARDYFHQARRDDGTPITVLFSYCSGFTECATGNAWHRDTETDLELTDAERERIEREIMETRSTQDQYDAAQED